ncbi:MAG: hypothetical protein ABSB74_02965 [Tepidisphaeraceae bacterium]
MNSQQKQAWLTVALAAVSVAAFGALWPVVGRYPAISAFGLFGFSGLGPLFYRKDTLDERDRTIARRAALAAGMISYGVFILGCMGIWGIVYQLRGSQQVSVHVLPLITGAGGFAFFLGYAITVLVMYGGRLEDDHG